MEIIVLGAGAIGSLYGAKLAAANHVTLIARPEHATAINEHGLRITGRDAEVVRIRAATRIDLIAPDTLILLATKVSASRTALTPIAPLIREDTTLLCLQNGLNSEEVARAAIGPRGVVLRAITHAGAIFEKPGTVNYTVVGDTLLEQHERSLRIADCFNAGGLTTRISANIKNDVWQKLIFNCVVNPITTMIGSEVGAIADSRLNNLKRLVIDECLAVAAAEGITFPADPLPLLNKIYAPSRNIVSMRQDLMRGHETEIEYLNGAVVSLGDKHQIDCPVNRALTSIIKAMEKQTH